MDGFIPASKSMASQGAYIAGEGLCGVETATSQRVRGGKVEAMNRPFAETREMTVCA